MDCDFRKMATGDEYLGRADFDYWCEDMSIQLGAGAYWLGLRNPGGAGSGTDYWMTSDAGPDGVGSSTGFFSLDAGNTWAPEGDSWHHAFEIVTESAGGGDCVNTDTGEDCQRLGGQFLKGENCASDPCP